MRQHLTPVEARAALRTRAQLLHDGWRPRDIDRALASGDIRRIQANRYVKGERWTASWCESRHLLQVMAAHAEMREGNGAFAYSSAGVLHELPLYRHEPSRVHVTLAGSARASSRAGLMRHREPLSDNDLTLVDGVLCTSIERTTFDVIRMLSREAAVAFADAALRREAMRSHGYDDEAADEWRDRMRARVESAPGKRGVRQAAEVIEFADGRAELPGESVSRVQLARLGFTRLGLQVEIPGPNGTMLRADIEIEEAATFLEFDGQGKYLDEAMRAGRDLEQVLMDEKRREDWIRGSTQKRVIRMEDRHITTTAAFAARLGEFGILPPAS